MGEETYARLDLDTLLRIAKVVLRVLGETTKVGEEILNSYQGCWEDHKPVNFRGIPNIPKVRLIERTIHE